MLEVAKACLSNIPRELVEIPQGLKPVTILVRLFGTTEVVP